MARETVPADGGEAPGGKERPPPARADDAGTTAPTDDHLDDLGDALDGVEVDGDLHVHLHVDGDGHVEGVETEPTDEAELTVSEADCGHGPVTGPLDLLATKVSWCSDAAHAHVRPFTVAAFLLAALAMLALEFTLGAVLNVATLVALVVNFVVMLAKTDPNGDEDDAPERRRV